jgi:HAD superfamily hydrolase (TIGR01509 family)
MMLKFKEELNRAFGPIRNKQKRIVFQVLFHIVKDIKINSEGIYPDLNNFLYANRYIISSISLIAYFRDCTMINWPEINTVLLDMDGTLLDLNFDTEFWLELIPLSMAKKKGITLQEAKQEMQSKYSSVEGKIEWYCLDYWQRELQLPILELKHEISHLIKMRPDTIPFLDALKAAGKRVILVTNAHPDSLSLKIEKTQLDAHIDELISCHTFGVTKEDQDLWRQLQNKLNFENKSTLFVDDSHQVLLAAKEFGIKHIMAVANPNSQIPAKNIKGFINVVDYRTLLEQIK